LGNPAAAGGAYSTPRDLLAAFKGPTSRGREGHGEDKREGKDMGGKGMGRPPRLF